jgi:ABC-type transport system substrate-binding protein
VSFSFNRELARCSSARLLAGVARIALRDPVTVLGPLRVRVNVTAASPLALAVLGTFYFGVLDSRAVEAHESAADPSAHGWLADHLAFYGAYELSQFDPARRLLARANPQFFRPLAFTDLAIEAVPSSTLRLADLGAGAASHTSGLDWTDFEIAAHTSGLRALTLASTAVSTLVPDERFRPFASVLVRRALSLAIDRAAISRAAFAGIATAALEPEPPPMALAPGVREPAYEHDVALARRLLVRAGYGHGFAVVLAASGADDVAAPAEMASIARQLRAIGVSVSVRYVPTVADLERLERDGTVGGVLETTAVPIASAAFAIAAGYLRKSPANIEGYDSPALNALAGPLSATAAGAALQRALTIVGATYPVIPLVSIPTQEVTRATIGGYAAYPTGAVYYDQLSR